MMELSSRLCNRKYLYYQSARFLARYLVMAMGIDLTCEGTENIPEDGKSLIFIANHQSNIDPVVLIASLKPRIAFIAKRILFKIPVIGRAFTYMGLIEVNRVSPTPGFFKKARHELQTGGSLLIFPEGTRSMDGKVHEAKPGAAYLVLKLGVPVIPIYIKGTYEVLKKGEIIPRIGDVHIKIGKMITLPPDLDLKSMDRKTRNNFLKEFSEQLMAPIKAMEAESGYICEKTSELNV